MGGRAPLFAVSPTRCAGTGTQQPKIRGYSRFSERKRSFTTMELLFVVGYSRAQNEMNNDI